MALHSQPPPRTEEPDIHIDHDLDLDIDMPLFVQAEHVTVAQQQ